MKPWERVIETARGELGYLEKASNANLDDKTANAGHNNWTKYARDLDVSNCYNGKKNGYAWCDMFVDWCFMVTFGHDLVHKMTFQTHGGYGAGCTSSANYYKKTGHFFTSDPQPGDQIFFTKDKGKNMYHTGLVVKVEGGRVHTIEGNTSSAAGVVENGGAVEAKSYSLTYSKIGGYGRPDWSLVPEEEPAVKLDNQTAPWSKEAVEWAVANKVMQGDEKGDLMLHSPMTREQFCVMLRRYDLTREK